MPSLTPSASSRNNSLTSLFVQALATPVQFWVGLDFYISAAKALRAGGANMSVLIVMGTSTAYGYSVLKIFAGFFDPPETQLELDLDTAMMITVFITAGKYMENRAKVSRPLPKY